MKKIDPDNELSWISIKILNLGLSSNIFRCILEELQMKFLMYLGTENLITLCYVSKCIKHLVLRNFNQFFCISIGFCSVKHWTDLIKKSCFSLTDDIHNLSFFDDTFFGYNFDFEENYFKLKKEFRHMSLFSICLHFLR